MDKSFYKKYHCYENYPIKKLKHIPLISVYNHNYFFGLKRYNEMVPDMIYVETDECSGISEYYHKDGEQLIHIGHSYAQDEFITLQQEELT